MTHSQRAAAVVLVMLTALGSTVRAQDAKEAGVDSSTKDNAKAMFGAGRVVDSQRLDRQRGGLDTSNRNSLDGSVHDTSATNVVTGSNSIADGSFANSAGLPTVIQNTGANVLIQNSTIVNVQFK